MKKDLAKTMAIGALAGMLLLTVPGMWEFDHPAQPPCVVGICALMGGGVYFGIEYKGRRER